MATRTRRAQVKHNGIDLGEKDVTLVDIIEEGGPVGLYAHFEHQGQVVSRSVKSISPREWDQVGVIPAIELN